MEMFFTLKPWLTLTEAAVHLSSVLGVEVDQSDILRLALQRKVTLSVHVVDGTYARKWEMRDRLPGDEEPYTSLFHLSRGKPAHVPTDKIIHTGSDAVLDLPMTGSEYYVALQFHQELRGLPDSEDGMAAVSGILGGWFFVWKDGGLYQAERHLGDDNPENPNLNPEWQHPENFSWYPLNHLPFVVRRAAIEVIAFGADVKDAAAERAATSNHIPTSSKSGKKRPRQDVIDPQIDKAIELAGSDEESAVFVELRKIALAEGGPFTGHVERNALLYTDEQNKPAKINKEALGKRLQRRRNNGF